MSEGITLAVRRNGDVFNPRNAAEGRQNVLAMMDGVIHDAILSELKRWTGTWRHKVTIRTDHRGSNQFQVQARYIIVGEESPDDKDPVAVFIWVSHGVAPHSVEPREPGGLLFFRAGRYTPATTPQGPTGRTGGVRGDEFVFSHGVDHPGIVARNIEQKIIAGAAEVVFANLSNAVLEPFRKRSAR